jgi:hypothetical protein
METANATGFVTDYNMAKPNILESTPGFRYSNRPTLSTDFTPTYHITEFTYLTSHHIKGLSENSKKILYEFLYILDSRDRDAIISVIKEIDSCQFVESIDFENCHVPTLIINLPKINRDHEKKIYSIEYHFLKKTKVKINLYINFP